MADIKVIIPAFNEANSIAHVINELPKSVSEVIVVNNNSTDDTVKNAEAIISEVQLCNGADGTEGATGPAGASGISIKALTQESTTCANGGINYSLYMDSNDNNIKDADEPIVAQNLQR